MFAVEFIPQSFEGALNETIGGKASYVLQLGPELIRFGGNADCTNCCQAAVLWHGESPWFQVIRI